MSNEDALRRLLATSVDVDVEGETITLILPEPDAIAKVQEILMVAARGDDDVNLGAITEAIATAVHACLGNKNITFGEAKQTRRAEWR